MEPKARAERCLRRLSVAAKTFALYPPPHPMSAQAAESLLAELRQYTGAFGPFGARITKRAFAVDGTTFEGGAHGNLAFYFFTRRLSHLTIRPAVTEKELTAFLQAVCMDRLTLEETGGVAYLLWQAEARNVEVAELTLEQEAEQETLGLNAFFALLGKDRLSPRERETVIEILRGGPRQAARLLENVHAVAGQVYKDIGEEELAQVVFQAVRGLDRLILDEPLDEQAQLYANLAGAQLLLDTSLGARIQQALVSQAEHDPAARVVVNHLSDEQLAQIILGSLPAGEVTQQVTALIRVLCANRERARAVLENLEARLAQEGSAPGWLTETVLAQLRRPQFGVNEDGPPVFEFDSSQIAVSDADYERQVQEARAIDEAAAIREVIRTLVDVLRQEEDEDNQTAVAEALEGHLPGLIERREFLLLATVLEGLKDIAATAGGRRAELAAGLLRKVTEGRPVEKLLDAYWNGRGTPVEQEVLACLLVLADKLVIRLVRILGDESRAAMRASLCDLLVGIGGGHVDEIGVFVGDSRWYLARNIASILGRLRAPGGVRHLKRLVHHPEYRVRRETVDALAGIGTEDAEVLLAGSIDDPDPRIQVRALQSLDVRGVRQATLKLLALLQAGDFFNRQFELKQTAIEALGRVRSQDAVPVLQRLAGRRLVFGHRGRELRRLAGAAVTVIESPAPGRDEALVAAGEAEATRP